MSKFTKGKKGKVPLEAQGVHHGRSSRTQNLENAATASSSAGNNSGQQTDTVDDYMSDVFLATCVPPPGITKRKQDRRAHELYKKKMKVDQEMKEKMSEGVVRERGLKRALSSDNKGYQMLAKMGFKAGSSLGKSSVGIVEPIPIDIKTNTAGLGIASQKKTQITSDDQVDSAAAIESFQKTCASNYKLRLIKSCFTKAQLSCAGMDKSDGLRAPVKQFFWPKSELEKPESDEEEDDDEEDDDAHQYSDEKMSELVEYLRNVRLYCPFCCIRFQGSEEMNEVCPGPTFDDHPE